MRIKIIKCEARNEVIGNIDKYCALRDSVSIPEKVPWRTNAVGDFNSNGRRQLLAQRLLYFTVINE